MRTVSQLLDDKMDEAVTQYINSHQSNEVHVDSGPLSLNIHEDSGRQVVTVMHPQSFHHSSLARSVSIGEVTEVGETWNEELLDADGKLAAIVAHLAQHNRPSHTLLKVATLRSDLDSTVLTDGSIRLFNSHTLDEHTQPIQISPSAPTLPPLARCQQTHTQWLNDKTKSPSLIADNDTSVLEVVSPTTTKLQSKKSLPHKKRISRRLKRSNPTSGIQQELVVMDCQDNTPQEEILPDNFVPAPTMPEHGHHIAHEVRPIFICQICGDFYGEEQLKFYHHLKQHYEPHATIIIENPVPDLGIDKISNTCIVDNVSQLPDSLVELSLESTLPTKPAMYQTIKEHILYSTSDKTLSYNGNKVLYSMAGSQKDHGPEHNKESILYEELNKSFDCEKCSASFRKQKYYDAHVKDAHSKLEIEISEFSEPEDLMEGIHVAVGDEAGGEPREGGVGGVGGTYHDALLPHLGVDSGGQRHQHVRHWYIRDGVESQCGADGYSLEGVHPHHPSRNSHSTPTQLKEEVFQRIFEVNNSEPPQFSAGTYVQQVSGSPPQDQQIQETETVLPPVEHIEPEAESPQKPSPRKPTESPKKEPKQKHVFACAECGREFRHRNSLRYHAASHAPAQLRPHVCPHCGKGFFTPVALKVHQRIHTGDRPFTCSVCGKKFRQYSDVKYHISSIHSTEKQFKCEFCDKKFARKYSLNVHRTIHTGERKYQCDFCPKTFRASCYRKTHMRAHTGEKPYKCDVCGRAFRVKADLKRHSAIHSEYKVKIKMEISTEEDPKAPEKDDKANTNKKNNKRKPKPTPKIAETKKSKRGSKNFKSDTNEISKLNNRDEIEASKLLKSKIVNTNDYYMAKINSRTNRDFVLQVKRTDSDVKDSVVTKNSDVNELSVVGKTGDSEKEIRQNGESGEHCFIERLTALYNIPA